MSKCELSSTDVRASRLIGRVGGLAVALGVGAVWFSGGVAWADSGSESGATGRSSQQARGADNDAARSTGPSRQARVERTSPRAAASTARAQRNSDSNVAVGKSAAAAPAPSAVDSVEVAPADVPVAAVQATTSNAAEPEAKPVAQPVAPTAAPVVDPEPIAVPEVAPVSAEVSAFATAGTDALDPSADTSPTAPISTPLEWAVAAFARRAAAPAAVVDPTYTQGLCTQQSSSCTYIVGPSGVPIPSETYGDTVMKYYILPNTTQQDTTAQLVFTPEGAYPVTGIKVLPLTVSVVQGQTEVENTINYLQPGPQTGNVPVTLFGYSQSAVISSLLQRDLDANPELLPGLDRDQLTFVTVGQEMSPDGGWFARYPGLNLPSLGEYFFGSTPEDSYPTTNYTLEYDGFADSPRYPGNFLSSLNAAMGILLVHTNYANEKYFANTYGLGFGTPFDPVMGEFGPGIACNQGSSSCIELPTTSPTQKYYFIKTPYLPLLAPVRAIPFIGRPIAALIEPALKVIVDLGYGDQAHGFTSAPQPYANVPAPFGLFPQVSPIEVATKLVAGVQQGFTDFFAELRNGGGGGGINLPSLGEILGFARAWVTELPARVNMAGSALYATLLATADFANAMVTALPGYHLQVAADSIKKVFTGELNLIEGLISAVGLPWASTVGLAAVIGVVQSAVWLEGILAAITGCGPAAPQANMCLVPSLA